MRANGPTVTYTSSLQLVKLRHECRRYRRYAQVACLRAVGRNCTGRLGNGRACPGGERLVACGARASRDQYVGFVRHFICNFQKLDSNMH